MQELDLYQKFIDQINKPIIIFNNSFEIVYFNTKFLNLLRLDNESKNNDIITFLNDKKIFNVIKEKSSISKGFSNNFELFINNSLYSVNSSFINVDKKQFDLLILEDLSRNNAALLNECIYRISEASHYVDDLMELYNIIHKILSKIIYTENFYIATADWDNNIVHFPYFVDKYDSKPDSKDIGNGLTDYVLKSGESILVNPSQYNNLLSSKKINVRGSKSVDWLGIPLKIKNNQTIGAIVVQSYDKKIRFSEEDEKILTFVSDQIAMAIKRKIDTIEIENKAYYDQLTGLTNKILFNDRLDQAIHNAERNNSLMCVMFIDLDNFKYVNDSMGHTAGDTLLKLVAKRMKKCLRKTDTVSRWGGDEFTIILPSVRSIKDISILCNRILNKELNNIVVDNQELRITASIGVAMYPQDGKELETLVKNADAAMYKAKEKGKNRFEFFKPKMNKDILERVTNENNLFKAIEKEEFMLLYQPQIELETNKIIGFEALIRWNSPDKGVLAPYKFIPIAEETNLIIPLGEWIIEQTCIQNKKWHDKGYKLTSAVNISAKQFLSSNLSRTIKKSLSKTGLDPKYLELELTETILMDNIKKTVEILQDLKKMGIKVSIDDFGTGYSSLSYLKKFPIDTLKIDQSFISPISNVSISDETTIANIVIDLGHKLGLKVIAEGVETQDQIEFLKEYACDKIQGYIISEPVNEIEFNLLLDKHP